MVGSADRDESIWNITALSCGNSLIFKPALDGYVLLMNHDVPLITGNTKDESGACPTTNFTVSEYTEYCTEKYGNLSSRYFELYPGDNNATQGDMAWNAAARDTSLVSSWAYANGWISSPAESPFYTYYWGHAPAGQDQGAFHQSEIMYALNALYANADAYPFTEEDFAIAKQMTAYWTNFIKTGNPNGNSNETSGDLAHWYPNDGSSNYVMHLGDGWG
ncbi:hypothetical protein LQW54_000855 [Pestalotiopsis sp. IQ-011]